jgi:hypothetical protein
MREGTRNKAVAGTVRQPMFETLEGRQLMSAVPLVADMHTTTAMPAIEMSATPAAKVAPKVVAKAKVVAKPATKVNAKAFPAYVPSSSAVKGKNVVGTWTGSMRLDGSKTDADFSITFVFQRGVAASGTFNLGATMNNQIVTSTMVFDLHNNVRAMVATPTLAVGFTGALSTNGQILYGRFSFNNGSSWKTGMFTLTRA